MPPLAGGTTLSRLCPPLSVSRSDGPKLGRLASAAASASASASMKFDCHGTKSTPPKVSEASTRWRNTESSAPASAADRYCTSALAISSLDSNCCAKPGARPPTRSARSASRSVAITSTAIQLAAASATSTTSVTTKTMRRRIDRNETGPACILNSAVHGTAVALSLIDFPAADLTPAHHCIGVRTPGFGEKLKDGMSTASQSRQECACLCRYSDLCRADSGALQPAWPPPRCRLQSPDTAPSYPGSGDSASTAPLARAARAAARCDARPAVPRGP